MKYAILIATLALLAACNTIEGMGEDIGHAGDAISDTAQKTKKKL